MNPIFHIYLLIPQIKVASITMEPLENGVLTDQDAAAIRIEVHAPALWDVCRHIIEQTPSPVGGFKLQIKDGNVFSTTIVEETLKKIPFWKFELSNRPKKGGNLSIPPGVIE